MSFEGSDFTIELPALRARRTERDFSTYRSFAREVHNNLKDDFTRWIAEEVKDIRFYLKNLKSVCPADHHVALQSFIDEANPKIVDAEEDYKDLIERQLKPLQGIPNDDPERALEEGLQVLIEVSCVMRDLRALREQLDKIVNTNGGCLKEQF